MSAFGAKRKARKITVQDQDDDDASAPSVASPSASQDFDQGPALQPTFKSRPFKQSSLRKTINLSDDGPKDSTEDDEDGGAPLVVRPSLGGRSASSKIKKRAPNSKLSFGASTEAAGGDDDAMILGGDDSDARDTAGSETGAYKKKGITRNNRLPLRSMETDEDRPRYSKEYLSELQSATPNAPADIGSLQIAEDDVEMSLDPSELEGATLVETAPAAEPTAILTEAQVREKKERRARLAQQAGAEDFISLSDDDRGAGESYMSVLSKRQPQALSQKKEKRLVADDNLDEDDSFFVEDGGLSLGSKAERAARRQKRADMASMIATAEGADDDDTSDDSEAERRAAYEAAQTRAGMDGLADEREQQRRRLGLRDGAGPMPTPPKIAPLPDLSVLLAAFQEKMGRQEAELRGARARIEELRREREGIERREPEVQQLLNEAGERYRSLMGGDVVVPEDGGANGTVAAAKSLLDQAKSTDTPGRGLESLGTTPLRQVDQMEM
ncbi:hypothetical protein JX265_007295 [Neoarthrinium moseri]|uniref:Nineteen complex-related protein 2-domain-containing protein n=1 Tax=Neoarthrinium moseri TaxID=1658444 RepID=A0A9P9WK46_9PEZI|nr:hypothetical protein JX265_007295 [Neoarthrinium moseri]